MAGFEVTPEAQALTVTSSISISIVFSVHSVHQLLESHNYGRFCVRRRSIIKVDENDEKIALRRMVAGRGILRNHGRNNNSPETGPETPDDTSWFGNWLALTNPVEMFLRFDRRAGFRARLSPAGRAKASAIFPGLQSSRVQDFRHRSSRTLCDSG